MKNHLIFMYILTTIIWSTTWLPIKLSIGVVPIEVSIIYRLTIASIILLIWCYIKNRSLSFSIKSHIYIALFGILLYGVNFILLYKGSYYLSSGLVAIVFSTISIFNIINRKIFLNISIDMKSILGMLIGIIGLCLLLWNDIINTSIDNDTITGFYIILAATYSASLGNIISYRNNQNKIPVLQGNAFGMMYATIVLIFFALINESAFIFETNITYISSLIYLSIFGSILAFGFYLTLINEIGISKASYINLLFPLLAIIISLIFEELMISKYMISGIVLIIVGNYIIFKKPKKE